MCDLSLSLLAASSTPQPAGRALTQCASAATDTNAAFLHISADQEDGMSFKEQKASLQSDQGTLFTDQTPA